MNKTEKVISQIMENEEELKEFLKQETMDDMYNFVLKKDNTITEEEFDKSIAEMLENCFSPEELNEIKDEDLENLSGGKNINLGAKAASMAASLMVLLSGGAMPAMNAAGTESISNGYSSATVGGGLEDTESVISSIQRNPDNFNRLPVLAVISTARKLHKPVKRLRDGTVLRQERLKEEVEHKGRKRLSDGTVLTPDGFKEKDEYDGKKRPSDGTRSVAQRQRIDDIDDDEMN